MRELFNESLQLSCCCAYREAAGVLLHKFFLKELVFSSSPLKMVTDYCFFFRSSSWFTTVGCGPSGLTSAALEAPLTLYDRKAAIPNMVLLLIKSLTI